MLPLPVGEGWGEGSKRLKNRLLIHQYYCLPPPRPSPAAGFALRGRGNSWAVSVLFHYTYTSSAQVYVKPYKTKSLHGESSSGNIFLLSICKEYTMTYPPAIEKALAYLQEKKHYFLSPGIGVAQNIMAERYCNTAANTGKHYNKYYYWRYKYQYPPCTNNADIYLRLQCSCVCGIMDFYLCL